MMKVKNRKHRLKAPGTSLIMPFFNRRPTIISMALGQTKSLRRVSSDLEAKKEHNPASEPARIPVVSLDKFILNLCMRHFVNLQMNEQAANTSPILIVVKGDSLGSQRLELHYFYVVEVFKYQSTDQTDSACFEERHESRMENFLNTWIQMSTFL